jgi:hypothetical protein
VGVFDRAVKLQSPVHKINFKAQIFANASKTPLHFISIGIFVQELIELGHLVMHFKYFAIIKSQPDEVHNDFFVFHLI